METVKTMISLRRRQLDKQLKELLPFAQIPRSRMRMGSRTERYSGYVIPIISAACGHRSTNYHKIGEFRSAGDHFTQTFEQTGRSDGLHPRVRPCSKLFPGKNPNATGGIPRYPTDEEGRARHEFGSPRAGIRGNGQRKARDCPTDGTELGP